MKNTLLLATGLLLAATAMGFTLLTPGRAPRPEPAPRSSLPAGGPHSPAPLSEAPVPERARVAGDAAPLEAGFFALPRGRRFEHTFEAALDSSMTFGDPAQEVELATQVNGRLVALVVAAEDDKVALQLALEDVDLTIKGTGVDLSADQQKAAGQEFESTSFVLMASDGRTLGHRFPEDLRAEARNLVRSLWSALHCVVPAEGAAECRVEEADASGPFLTHFVWEVAPRASGAGTLSKRREPATGHDDAEGGNGTRGSGKAKLPLDLRWPTEATYEETGSIARSEMGLEAEQSATYRFDLVGADHADASQLPEVELDGDWAPASGYADAVATSGTLDRKVKHDLSETSLDELIQEIAALVAAEQQLSRELYEACESLAELLRREPQQFDRLVELLDLGALEGTVAMCVLAAVGSVDGPEAQGFLAARIGDADAPEIQAYALASVMQVEKPGIELLTVVQETAAQRGTDDPLYAHGMLALGALASRPSGSSAIDFLLAEEERAEDTKALILWLAALGNSGNAGVVAKVEPYLSHEDAEVRATAAAALRHVMTAEAVALLRRASLGDQSEDVRGTAVEVLAQRGASTDDEAVAMVLQRDEDVGVRRRAVDGLGRRAPRDDFALLQLLDVSSSDADEDLRELARAYLDG